MASRAFLKTDRRDTESGPALSVGLCVNEHMYICAYILVFVGALNQTNHCDRAERGRRVEDIEHLR